jgi:hypothetical protein
MRARPPLQRPAGTQRSHGQGAAAVRHGAQECEEVHGAADCAGVVAGFGKSDPATQQPPQRGLPRFTSYGVHSPHQLPLVASTRTCQSLKWSSVICTVPSLGARSPASVTLRLTGRGRGRRALIAASAPAHVPLCAGSTAAGRGLAAAGDGVCAGGNTATAGLVAVMAPLTAAAPTGPAAAVGSGVGWGMAWMSRRSRAWRTVLAGCC